MSNLGSEHLPELLTEFAASRWEEMTINAGELSLTISKHGPPTATAPAPASAVPAPQVDAAPDSGGPAVATGAAPPQHEQPAEAAAPVEQLAELRSPVLGAFYAAPKPGGPPFVNVGDTVTADDTVCIIEVMKLMNQVSAAVDGEVVEICVSDGEMVEFDQVLMRFRPSGGG